MLLTILSFIVKNIAYIFFGTLTLFILFRIYRRRSHQENAQALLDEALRSTNAEPLSLHPEIDPNKCSGCGACTMACPEGDIIRMINHRASLVSPTKCVGHGECERACPMDAITLVFGTKTRGADIPRLTVNYETNVPGMYIAGELGGMGLLRNATRQGAMATQHAIANLASAGKAQVDVLIVGAGAAGLTSALACIAAKKSYLLIEQEKFGGTIAHFPRQKLVMSHPLDLPIVGRLKFNSNVISKENLLGYWGEIRKRTGLKVHEGVKFNKVEKRGSVFVAQTSHGEYTARKVVLAMGVRGTARKLGVPGEELPKVTYNLIEPEQYQKKNVIVVGGGNAASEAALMLSERRWGNKVTMLVRGPTLDRTNDTNRAKIEAQVAKGALDVLYDCEVKEIEAHQVKFVRGGRELGVLPNDFVFIFAGAEMPRAFLMSLGVKIDKKFGEALRAR